MATDARSPETPLDPVDGRESPAVEDRPIDPDTGRPIPAAEVAAAQGSTERPTPPAPATAAVESSPVARETAPGSAPTVVDAPAPVAGPGPTAPAETAEPAQPAETATADRAATTADAVVSMRGVSRTFGDRAVVRDVDLTVPRGTILGIIGPSGAGKTTTIRMLTGGLTPSTGEVIVLGRPPKKFRRSDRERIGYMPQLFTLYGDLTAGENVDFVASLFGMLFRRRRRRVREVLRVVDLWDARGRVASKLSGGMQRRLELACALVHEPDLIILDEPTAGIDPLLRGTIWEELHRLRDAGRTLLVTTQHVAEAEECDSVAMIVGGRIIALAPPDELRRMATNGDLLDIQTATVFDGSDLVGMPGVGQVTQDTPRHVRVVVEDAGSALPQIVERIRAKGVEVESAQENRLSFDEIFAILVSRSEADAPTAAEGSANEANDPGRAAA